MNSVGSQGQVLGLRHRVHGQIAIQVGKQLLSPAFFPFEGIAQDIRIDGNQQKSILACLLVLWSYVYWEVRLANHIFCLFVSEMRPRFFCKNKKKNQNFHQKIAKI